MNSLIIRVCLSHDGIAGWGLAFATLGLVAMSGAVWLKLFRKNKEG